MDPTRLAILPGVGIPTLASVYRRAYAVLVGTAALMGALAVITALALDKRWPTRTASWVPRGCGCRCWWAARSWPTCCPARSGCRGFRPAAMPAIFRARVRSHWTRERVTLVVMGSSASTSPISYRNLKSFLPFVLSDKKYDRELHLLDRVLMFGNDPAVVMHDLLGTGVTAWVLSIIYLWFLPLVPLALTAWLVWSRNLTYGYWFATSQCIAWALGTLSYYALPTLGPGSSTSRCTRVPRRRPRC